MPAILKGWIDRVYARGFAYGVGTFDGFHYGLRSREGTFQGKRAMIMLTVGGDAVHYGPRGVNGSIDDLLWPIQQGVLFYSGMAVLPPLIFYEVKRADAAQGERSLRCQYQVTSHCLFSAVGPVEAI